MADDGQVAENLRATARCPVCLDYYDAAGIGAKAPTELIPCNHLVCEQCVQRITTCPECRTPVIGIRNGLNQWNRTMREQMNQSNDSDHWMAKALIQLGSRVGENRAMLMEDRAQLDQHSQSIAANTMSIGSCAQALHQVRESVRDMDMMKNGIYRNSSILDRADDALRGLDAVVHYHDQGIKDQSDNSRRELTVICAVIAGICLILALHFSGVDVSIARWFLCAACVFFSIWSCTSYISQRRQ